MGGVCISLVVTGPRYDVIIYEKVFKARRNWKGRILARENLGKMSMSQMASKINQYTKFHHIRQQKSGQDQGERWWGRVVIRGKGYLEKMKIEMLSKNEFTY